MTAEQTYSAGIVHILQRANEIAATTSLEELLNQILDFCIELTHARSGVAYLYNRSEVGLVLRAKQGINFQRLANRHHLSNQHNIVQEALQHSTIVLLPDTSDYAFQYHTESTAEQITHQMCFIPIKLEDRAVGMFQLFGLPADMPQTAEELKQALLVIERLAADVEKNRLLEEQRRLLTTGVQREQRLEALLDFVSHISTTLEREELIRLIMSYVEELLNVEATSFWLLDEHTQRLHLLVAGGDSRDKMHEVSMAVGEGIIGHVVKTGQRKVVNDVTREPLFTNRIDLQSGFETHAILTVPMRAPAIQRGDTRGVIEETIIGGAQALNKRDGTPFTAEDVRIFETLSRQAAIAFQFSRLFEEDYTLFWGVVRATTSAIDFIDPYTRGHSARVSDFSVAIAQELNLTQRQIYQVLVGSVLHDVGKIGVSAQILRKPGRLTESEFAEIQQHPLYGVRLFKEAGLGTLLQEELLALAQHHERLNGKGYPAGLKDEQISQIARIVAVADVFDALTSDRVYRSAYSVDRAFDILDDMADTELDANCIAALKRARIKGKIRVESERMLRKI